MKKILITITASILCFSVFSQTDSTSNEEFRLVQVKPEFPGGDRGLMEYLITVEYPIEALDGFDGHACTSYVEFVVEKDGSVAHVKVSNSSGIPELDKIAVNHVENMPNWSPGMTDDKPVRVKFVVPIRFELGGKPSKKKKR